MHPQPSHAFLTLALFLATAATKVSAQGGWILGSYFTSDGCSTGSDQWYLADSTGGEWSCSDLYVKNPDGDVPGEKMKQLYWSGAEDCGPEVSGCGDWVSKVVLYGEGDEGCEGAEVGSYTETTCQTLSSDARYFMVKDL